MAPPLRLTDAATFPSGGPELRTVQVAERPHDLLHLLPGGDAGADLGLERLRDVKGVGPAGRAAKAQREMGTMLRPVLTVAAGAATAAVRLSQGAEHDAGRQPREPSQERGRRGGASRHRCHQ